MQNNKWDIVRFFRREKRFNFTVAIYLSSLFFALIVILLTTNPSEEIKQVLVVILALITVSTLDAFKKSLEGLSSFFNEFSQIIVEDGGLYVNPTDLVQYNNQASKKRQTLAEAAAEIQQLLTQLEKSNPTATDAEKVAYVEQETSPALKARISEVLKTGSNVWLDAMLDIYPGSNIARAVIAEWASSEKQDD